MLGYFVMSGFSNFLHQCALVVAFFVISFGKIISFFPGPPIVFVIHVLETKIRLSFSWYCMKQDLESD